MLPKEVLPLTSGILMEERSTTSKVIYNTIIIAILIIVIALPFVYVDISVKGPAVIRPSAERSTIRSLVNGRIKESFVKENQAVKKGDMLFVIESNVLEEKEKFLKDRIQEIAGLRNDLKTLIPLISQLSANAGINEPHLITSLYLQSFSNYRQKWNESYTRYLKVKRDYDRHLQLHSQKVISDAEFENFKFELNQAEHDLEILKQSQLTQWETELKTHENQLADNNTTLAQLLEEKGNLVIEAPVSGTVQNHAGIYTGSMVLSNQDLAQISPDTSLVVEAYVSPNDIGLLRERMPVRFQIDAFNYNQWGLASGRITEISNDILIVNERHVFKIKCTLDKDHLALRNGYKGYLKKGMTLQARFMVTERSLWQLLYDKIDDWVNPNTYEAGI